MSIQSIGDYWKDVWRRGISAQDANDKHTAVLRVRNGKAVDAESWSTTLLDLYSALQLSKNDVLLDFCCGNGLIALPASAVARKVHAVDINADLVQSLASERKGNVEAIVADASGIEFEAEQFDKIVWYAGIQYFDDGDIVRMIGRLHRWLKPGGRMVIGDIPDREQLWKYFYNAEGEKRYFNGLRTDQPLIGNWIDREWLRRLGLHTGFSTCHHLAQHPKAIYADFRYDFLLVK